MRRREFVGRGVALAGGMALCVPAADAAPNVLAAGEQGSATILADRLLQAYPLRRSLAVIGMAARQEPSAAGAPCPTCLPSAIQDFLRHLDWPEAQLRQMSPAAILERIKAGTARDFSLGRILLVRGWLLGETEVRLCAVAALRQV